MWPNLPATNKPSQLQQGSWRHRPLEDLLTPLAHPTLSRRKSDSLLRRYTMKGVVSVHMTRRSTCTPLEEGGYQPRMMGAMPTYDR